MLNSLTGDGWFSLIDYHLLMFRIPGLFLQKLLYISWSLPYLSQNYLRGFIPGLNPQFCLPNKT